MNKLPAALRILILASSMAATSLVIQAQAPQRFVCGTEDVDIEITKANIAAAKAYAKTHPDAYEKGNVTYVPMRFKLVGNSDGTLEPAAPAVVNHLEAINRDFAQYDWRFFLEDVDGAPFDYYFNDDYNGGLQDNDDFVRRNRSSSAITFFVVNSAASNNNGVTLGYYSPSQDIMVVRTSTVTADASTATHELGHFFGLPHTFRGWDFETWDGVTNTDPEYNSPVQPLIAPNTINGQNVRVELVTRGDGANCDEAGDLFCDTGADYNLGFGFSGCDYRGPVRDRNGDQLQPNEDNHMSYFQDCPSYEFSPDQFDAVRANYRSARRNFLRGGAAPINLDTVRGQPTVTAPALNAVTDFSDEVTLAWDPVPGAVYYYVELNTSRNFAEATAVRQTTVSQATSLVVDGLESGRRYHVRVTPYNQLTVGLPSARVQFRTGTVSSTSVPQAVEGLHLSPNPTPSGRGLTAELHAAQPGAYALSTLDATGRVIASEEVQLVVGVNRVELPAVAQLPAGAYVLHVRSDRGASARRFVVR